MTMIIDHDRRNAYGIVGTALTDTTDAQQALIRGGLNYTMELAPATAIVGGRELTAPKTFLNVRRDADGTVQLLSGSHGNEYDFIQNLDTVELMQQVVDSAGATFGAVGHTHNGARTFAQLLLPDSITIGGRDRVDLSLMGLNTHDGSGKFTLAPLATRFYCTNQFPGIKRTETRFQLTHSKKALAWDVEAVRHALELTGNYAERIQFIGDTLADAPMPKKEFLQFLDVISPKMVNEKTGDEYPSSEDRRVTIADLFDNAPNLDNVRGTRWAAWQAVVEYHDHIKPAKTPTGRATRIVIRTDDIAKWGAAELLLAGV